MKTKCTILMLILILLFCSCAKIAVPKPEGFAEIAAGKEYRAVSPEGMPFRVRSFKNYPEMDLAFWKDALKSHLIQEGYKFISEVTPDESREDIVCFEWGAPYGGADYIYLTAVKVKGKKIFVAEAAGKMEIYGKYRQSLLDSLAELD